MTKQFRNKCNRQSKINLQDILSQWNCEVPEVVKQKNLKSRRLFLEQSIVAAGSVVISARAIAKTKTSSVDLKKLSQPWLTLSEVQEHLFPRSTDKDKQTARLSVSPGAKDIHAIEYLQTMLNTPDVDGDEKEFIIKGVEWLDGVANGIAGKPFIKLNKASREQVIKKISESSAGENWLSTLLRYIFEALLTDPVYGGNTNKSGWQWLEHQPGFPLPPENKKYWLLRNSKTAIQSRGKV